MCVWKRHNFILDQNIVESYVKNVQSASAEVDKSKADKLSLSKDVSTNQKQVQ